MNNILYKHNYIVHWNIKISRRKKMIKYYPEPIYCVCEIFHTYFL